MYYLTKKGYKKFKRRLQALKKKRKKVAQRIKKAKEMGDISESAGYEKAKEDQAFLEGKIQKIKETLKNAKVVSKKTGNRVGIGSVIEIKANSSKKVYELVGEGEADPSSGKISYASPLGKEFMGRKAGDKVEVAVPEGKKVYRIVKVRN